MKRRDFLCGLTASFAFAGCRVPWWLGKAPNLKFGVISDIHMTTPDSTAEFRRALIHFRDCGADAVLVAGDLTDWGLLSGLKAVADVWYDVFPGDRAPDGRKIEKLFITGNHDYDGWQYGDMALDMHTQGYSEDEALVRLGLKGCWEKTFHEPFADIRTRTVKGYAFVSSEWCVDGQAEGDAAMAKWLESHAGELHGERPFFFFRHSPVPGTVVASPEKPSVLTETLCRFPNCVAFSGHKHWTLNDERSVWQGDFTAISIPSLSYTSMPKGYENGFAGRQGDAKVGMAKLPSRIDLEEAQGYFVSVYDNRMEVERYDFEHMTEAARPWVVPLGRGREKPYSFARHAKTTPVPQFPCDAEVKTHVVNAETRDNFRTIFMVLEFPAAEAPGGCVFDYEVRAEMESDGSVAAFKRFLSPGFYKLPEDRPVSLRFLFDTMDVPDHGRYRFKVYPRNCFGGAGAPIASRVFESKPGRMSSRPLAQTKG